MSYLSSFNNYNTPSASTGYNTNNASAALGYNGNSTTTPYGSTNGVVREPQFMGQSGIRNGSPRYNPLGQIAGATQTWSETQAPLAPFTGKPFASFNNTNGQPFRPSDFMRSNVKPRISSSQRRVYEADNNNPYSTGNQSYGAFQTYTNDSALGNNVNPDYIDNDNSFVDFNNVDSQNEDMDLEKGDPFSTLTSVSGSNAERNPFHGSAQGLASRQGTYNQRQNYAHEQDNGMYGQTRRQSKTYNNANRQSMGMTNQRQSNYGQSRRQSTDFNNGTTVGYGQPSRQSGYGQTRRQSGSNKRQSARNMNYDMPQQGYGSTMSQNQYGGY